MADLPLYAGAEYCLQKRSGVELIFLCYSSEQNASCNEKIQQET